MHQAITMTRRVLTVLVAFLVLPMPWIGATQAPGSGEDLPDALSAGDWSSIRQAYAAERYSVRASQAGYKGFNHAQQWQLNFDGRGFWVQPDARGEAGWTWGLELLSYGFLGQACEVAQPVQTRVAGGRVVYDWDEFVEEWYINDSSGLEHGYTVRQRPPHLGHNGEQGPLVFTLGVRGELTPAVMKSGLGVRFVNAAGVGVLTYSGLKVFDADGRVLTAWFEGCDEELSLFVNESGARYPLTIDPTAQETYLKASNSEAFDVFGAAIAISGKTVVVGATGEDGNSTTVNGDQSNNDAQAAGAAYVFVRSGTGWSQQAYLKASNSEAADQFGFSVAIAGNTIVVGALNEKSSASGVNGDQSDNSANESGAAYVFVRSGTSWSQQAYLKASNTGLRDHFGSSVAISGDTIVVGAYEEDSNATGVDGDQVNNGASQSGAAYVFVRSAANWSQQAYLKASNTGASDRFGSSVAVSGDIVVVGASDEASAALGVNGDGGNDDANLSGAAYVFVRSGTSWSQEAYLKASNTGSGDRFGRAVAISKATVVIGAQGEGSNSGWIDGDQSNNSAFSAGAAYVFVRAGGAWSQEAYLKAFNPNAVDLFGFSVAISNDLVVVGARNEGSNATGVISEYFPSSGLEDNEFDNTAPSAGAAYVFVRSASEWRQHAYLKASNTDEFDWFGGSSIAVSGHTVAAGARLEDSSASAVNGDESDNSSDSSGAAYIFDVCVLELESTELVLLGSPPNPDAFRPGLTSGPVLGAVWDPYVDHSTFAPAALVDIFGLQRVAAVPLALNLQSLVATSSTAGIPAPIVEVATAMGSGTKNIGFVGTLICDRARFRLKDRVPAGVPFAIEIPQDCSLVGTSWCAQAASIGADGMGHLTNALQITIGSF